MSYQEEESFRLHLQDDAEQTGKDSPTKEDDPEGDVEEVEDGNPDEMDDDEEVV